MRLPLFILLASISAATAARPVDSAINTAQGVGSQSQSGPFAQRTFGLSDGDAVPELYPGENQDVGPQLLVMSRARKTWFEAGADAQYFYTSNALLSEKGNVDTGILLSTAFVGIAPTPFDFWKGRLAVRAGYRQQMFNYALDSTSNQLNNLDFSVGTVYLNGRYTFAEHWTASLGFEYNRYLSADADFNEFYTEALPQWGIERVIPINDRNQVLLGYFGAYHLTRTDPQPQSNANDRIDDVLLVSTVHQVAERVILQPYYRFQHTHYWENSDRNDWFHSVGLALNYAVTDWAALRVFTSYEQRESNDPTIPDYHKFDTGGGLSLGVRF